MKRMMGEEGGTQEESMYIVKKQPVAQHVLVCYIQFISNKTNPILSSSSSTHEITNHLYISTAA